MTTIAPAIPNSEKRASEESTVKDLVKVPLVGRGSSSKYPIPVPRIGLARNESHNIVVCNLRSTKLGSDDGLWIAAYSASNREANPSEPTIPNFGPRKAMLEAAASAASPSIVTLVNIRFPE